MNRRGFLTRGLAISGVALGGVAGLLPRRSWASPRPNDAYSIDVVTDRPDQAVQSIERIIQDSRLGRQVVRYSEYRLPGIHVGDIAYVRNRQLVNYHGATDKIAPQLRETATALSLPRRIDNPVLLRFCAEARALTPTDAQVFCGDMMVKQFPLDRATDAHRIDGARGHLEVAVENRSIKVVSASCKHKTCMSMGAISRPGQRLICIPNQITVAIAGTNGLGVDGITF